MAIQIEVKMNSLLGVALGALCMYFYRNMGLVQQYEEYLRKIQLLNNSTVEVLKQYDERIARVENLCVGRDIRK